ncbi:MAG: DUF2642 domain-containing protein [Bacillota bacterium]
MVDTVRGAVSGVLVDVKPDHITAQEAPGAPPSLCGCARLSG